MQPRRHRSGHRAVCAQVETTHTESLCDAEDAHDGAMLCLSMPLYCEGASLGSQVPLYDPHYRFVAVDLGAQG